MQQKVRNNLFSVVLLLILGYVLLRKDRVGTPVRMEKKVPKLVEKPCDNLGGCHLGWKPTASFYPPSLDLNFTHVSAPPVELVLARFKEDLTWIRDLPVSVTVYEHYDTASPRFVPNQGAESTCYIRHIIDRYDTLSNVTVFMQAGGKHHNWKILEWILALRPDMQGWVSLNSDPMNGLWQLSGRGLKEVWPGIRRLAAAWGAEGWHVADDWIKELEAGKLATYCCQQFAVSRDTIQRWPKKFYQILLDLLLDPRGKEHGFGAEAWWGMRKEYGGAIVMEHLWHTVWGDNMTLTMYTREHFCRFFKGGPCDPDYKFCSEWIYHLDKDCPRK